MLKNIELNIRTSGKKIKFLNFFLIITHLKIQDELSFLDFNSQKILVQGWTLFGGSTRGHISLMIYIVYIIILQGVTKSCQDTKHQLFSLQFSDLHISTQKFGIQGNNHSPHPEDNKNLSKLGASVTLGSFIVCLLVI